MKDYYSRVFLLPPLASFGLTVLFSSVVIGGCATVEGITGIGTKYKQEIAALKEDKVYQERENDRLRSELQELHVKLAESKDNQKKLVQQIEELVVSAKRLGEKNKELEQEKTEIEKQNQELRVRLTRLLDEKLHTVKTMDAIIADLKQKFAREISSGKVLIKEGKEELVVAFIDLTGFHSGEVVIREGGKKLLDRLVLIIKKFPECKVVVAGYTDDEPIKTAKYVSNWELSAARAVKVLQYLEDGGQIASHRLQAVGYGEYCPLASNATSEGRRKNRRVEIIFRLE